MTLLPSKDTVKRGASTSVKGLLLALLLQGIDMYRERNPDVAAEADRYTEVLHEISELRSEILANAPAAGPSALELIAGLSYPPADDTVSP